ncbi:nucleotidyltransferase domain-containing protein [Paramicrobacterium fandaimingii]|uniref:nucleotidyltransferase domain-containing protein n=1 Tax=Paramicrobacterium fandaimingii TaxID=2708079 RepID=UPI00141E0E39|nr:nucleotidyltransferase domain-containing protein [Microbacterium fandaimingii]
MDFSDPASSVISPNMSRVLRRLSILTEATSGRRIHSLSGASSLSTTQRILDQLEVVGLVSATPIARSKLYTLNRDHLLWEPLGQLLSASITFEQRVGQTITELAPPDSVGVLFGSVARGTANAESDVDVLVVVPDNTAADARYDLVSALSDSIELLSGNRAQAIAVTFTELKNMVQLHDPLVDSWRREGRKVTPGPSLTQLMGRQSA